MQQPLGTEAFRDAVEPHVISLEDRVEPLRGKCALASIRLFRVTQTLLHEHVSGTRGHGVDLSIGTVRIGSKELWEREDAATAATVASQVVEGLAGRHSGPMGELACHFWLTCADILVDFTFVSTLAHKETGDRVTAILAGVEPLHIDFGNRLDLAYLPVKRIRLDGSVAERLERLLIQPRWFFRDAGRA